MATWAEFGAEHPDIADAVLARITAARHHVLATIRRDGSPRVSGTEVDIAQGDLLLGAMPGAVKTADLRRDSRYALHTNPGDGSMTDGDAKVSGRAVEITDSAERAALDAVAPSPPEADVFRLLIDAVSLVSITDDHRAMRVALWRSGQPLRTYERRGMDPAVRLR